MCENHEVIYINKEYETMEIYSWRNCLWDQKGFLKWLLPLTRCQYTVESNFDFGLGAGGPYMMYRAHLLY